MFVLNRRARRHHGNNPVARALELACPNAITMALFGLGGLLTASGLEWGLYPQVPAAVAGLVGGVIGAWLFMMSSGTPRPDPEPS